MDDPAQVAPAWDEAFAADRPTVIEIKADPEVPPIPPHLTYRQIRNLALATARDPEGAGILRNAARQIFGSGPDE